MDSYTEELIKDNLSRITIDDLWSLSYARFRMIGLEDWRAIESEDHVFYLFNLLHLLTNKKTIDLSDVAWYGKNNFPPKDIDINSNRYSDANIDYPIIVIKNIRNQYNNKYRCIDGRRRISKMLNLGKTKTNCYVVDFKDIKKYLIDPRNIGNILNIP